MLYPQGNFYPQGAFSPQAFQSNPFQSNPFQSNPQGSFNPQGNFGPQGSFGSPQGSFGAPGSAGPQAFANTPYGYPQQSYPQQTSGFVPGLPQSSNWQQPAQQQQHQAALQQHAMQQLLAHQLSAQQLAAQQPLLSNGATQPLGAWTQQPNVEQQIISRHQLLQQLAQYHYLVAQQLAQLAAQQTVQGSNTPFAGQLIVGAGQFIPGQLGGSFAPGITMH